MEKAPEEPVHKPINSVSKLVNLIRERWPEYVLEVVVIMVSITLSFAFDEWKEQKKKQETEQLYLKGLYSDIQIDINQLKEVITETKQVIQAARQLSSLDPRSTASQYKPFVSQTLLVFKRPRFIAEDATFSDLKSTGNMQVMSSFSLKYRLFDYYKQYETIVRVETAELEITNTTMGPYLLRRFHLAGKDSAAPAANWAAIASETEYQNMLLIRRSTREELLHDYQQLFALGTRILTQIKTQIN